MVAGWVVISGGPVMSKLRPIPQGVVPVCHPWSRASVNKTVIPLVVLTDLLGVGILVHGQSGDTPHRGAAVLPVPILRGLRGITPRQTQGLWQFQHQYSPLRTWVQFKFAWRSSGFQCTDQPASSKCLVQGCGFLKLLPCIDRPACTCGQSRVPCFSMVGTYVS